MRNKFSLAENIIGLLAIGAMLAFYIYFSVGPNHKFYFGKETTGKIISCSTYRTTLLTTSDGVSAPTTGYVFHYKYSVSGVSYEGIYETITPKSLAAKCPKDSQFSDVVVNYLGEQPSESTLSAKHPFDFPFLVILFLFSAQAFFTIKGYCGKTANNSLKSDTVSGL